MLCADFAGGGVKVSPFLAKATNGEVDRPKGRDGGASRPAQMSHPDWSPPFCEDPVQAAMTRARMFGEWDVGDVLVIGTHCAAPTAGRVRRKGDAFWFEV